jgi:phospholipid/cholesterol/gamma-HCH transport system substrate-binding protein
MADSNIELRVGLFVVISALLLGGFVVLLTGSELGSQKIYYVDFGYSGGLQMGAPVKLSGIKLGKITGMELIHRSQGPAPAVASGPGLGQRSPATVRARLSLGEQADGLLTEGARVLVGMQGLIGEPYLEMEPGPRDAPLLPEGTALRGVDAIRPHVMSLQLSALLEVVTELIGEGGSDGVGSLGTAIGRLVRRLDDLVAGRQDEIGGMLTDLARSARNFKELSESAASVMTRERLNSVFSSGSATLTVVKQELPVILTQARDTLRTVQKVVDRAEGSLSDETITEVVKDIQNATSRLDAMTKDGQALLGMIQRGEGTVGGFVQDPQVYDDLKELMRDLKRHPWKMLWRD